MRRALRVLAVLSCLLMTAACEGESASVLAVDLKTDLTVGRELATAETTWAPEPDAPTRGRSELRIREGVTLGDGLRIAEFEGVPDGTVYVVVRLLAPDGRVVGERSAVAEGRGNRVLTVVITRDCAAVTCPGAGDPARFTACLGGRCVDELCSPERPERCGEPECRADGECSAAVACVSAQCADGTCFGTASDALCAAGEICDPARGCVASAVDAGPMSLPDAGPVPLPDAGPPPFPCPEVTRAAGIDRWETSAALSRTFYPAGASSAVLVQGMTVGPDSMTAGPLGRRVSGPILLTATDAVPVAIEAELTRLAVSTVYLLGGTGSIGVGVEDALRARGRAVVRFAGANRYETAALVADFVGGSAGLAYVVSGDALHLSDGITASGAGGALGAPVLLTRTDALPAETAAALSRLGVTRTVVIGPTTSVSDAVVASLPSPVRIAGIDRFDTSVRTAEDAAARGAGVAMVALANGLDPVVDPVSAAGGGRVVLHVRSDLLPDTVAAFLRARADHAVLAGGLGAITEPVERQACDALR